MLDQSFVSLTLKSKYTAVQLIIRVRFYELFMLDYWNADNNEKHLILVEALMPWFNDVRTFSSVVRSVQSDDILTINVLVHVVLSASSGRSMVMVMVVIMAMAFVITPSMMVMVHCEGGFDGKVEVLKGQVLNLNLNPMLVV
jgi:hypothetical protein